MLLSHVLPHIYNPKSLIEEIKRVLKKNGVLIIVCPNKIFKFFYFFLNIFNNYIPDETISKHFSSKNVQDLFDNNWKLLETTEYSIQKKIQKKYLNSRFIIIFKKL